MAGRTLGLSTILAVALAATSARAQVDVEVDVQAPPAVSVDTADAPPDEAVNVEAAPAPAEGGDVADVTTFNAALAPHGEWLEVPGVGRVWRPYASEVGPGFTPYQSGGHWAYTEVGWTYVSDWDWGWAPFHYGNWWYQAGYGWIWRPGTRWAPAWVDWRYGGEYVGWAPTPPMGFVFGVRMGWGTPWCFLQTRYMVERSWRGYAVPVERVHVVYGMTNVVAVHEGRGYSAGPPMAHVVAAVGHPITPVHVAALGHAVPPATVNLSRPLVARPLAVRPVSAAPTHAAPAPAHSYAAPQPIHSTPAPTHSYEPSHAPQPTHAAPTPNSYQPYQAPQPTHYQQPAHSYQPQQPTHYQQPASHPSAPAPQRRPYAPAPPPAAAHNGGGGGRHR